MSNRSTHLAHPPAADDAPPAPAHSGAAIAIVQVQPYEEVGVVVTSPAVGVDGALDRTYAQEGDDRSPPLDWSPVADARSWAVIVQDPDAPHPEPVLHWAVWDLPASSRGLPAGVEPGPRSPQGGVQGLNGRGEPGYMGPKPPPGHGVHRYHFQVFAVGKILGLPPTTTLVELVSALKGSTVASGELVATYVTPDPQDLAAPGGEAPAR